MTQPIGAGAKPGTQGMQRPDHIQRGPRLALPFMMVCAELRLNAVKIVVDVILLAAAEKVVMVLRITSLFDYSTELRILAQRRNASRQWADQRRA